MSNAPLSTDAKPSRAREERRSSEEVTAIVDQIVEMRERGKWLGRASVASLADRYGVAAGVVQDWAGRAWAVKRERDRVRAEQDPARLERERQELVAEIDDKITAAEGKKGGMNAVASMLKLKADVLGLLTLPAQTTVNVLVQNGRPAPELVAAVEAFSASVAALPEPHRSRVEAEFRRRMARLVGGEVAVAELPAAGEGEEAGDE